MELKDCRRETYIRHRVL